MGLINDIPKIEFETFEYDRGGNVTSAHIEATNSRFVDDHILVDEIVIKSDYGPAVNFRVKITGYKREILDSNEVLDSNVLKD